MCSDRGNCMLLGDILICVCNYGFDGSLCECCLF